MTSWRFFQHLANTTRGKRYGVDGDATTATVTGDGQRFVREDRALNVKLMEFEAHKAEIRDRTDFQNRIIQIYVTALSLAVGAILTVEKSPESAAALVVLVTVATSIAGMWYFDHALAVDRIGTYIATDIELYLANSLVAKPGFMRYEWGNMLEDVRWPKQKSWGFSEIILFTFFIPAFLSWVGGLILFFIFLYTLLVLLYFVVSKFIDVVTELELLAGWDVLFLFFYLPSRWDVVILFFFILATYLFYQYMILSFHWKTEFDLRSEKILTTLAYRYYRASCDPQWHEELRALVSCTYSFCPPSSDGPGDVADWRAYLEKMGSGLPGFNVGLEPPTLVRDAPEPTGRLETAFKRLEEAVKKEAVKEDTVKKEAVKEETVKDKIRRLGRWVLLPLCDIIGEFRRLGKRFLLLLCYFIISAFSPSKVKDPQPEQIPPNGSELKIEVTYTDGMSSAAPKSSIETLDTLRIVNGQVAEHRILANSGRKRKNDSISRG